MGRLADLITEVLEGAEVGEERIELPDHVRARLGTEWEDDDVEYALGLVHEMFLRDELVASADSLNSRMMDVLGEFGTDEGFRRAQAGGAVLSIETMGQLARRIHRVEEVLLGLRDDPPPDRRGFDALRRRLMDLGIEAEMAAGRREPLLRGPDEDEDEDE